MYDVCTIAHITKDVNTTPSQVRELPGGTAYYFGSALRDLPVRHHLITKLSLDDYYLLDDLDRNKVTSIPSDSSHFYENIYPDYSDHRIQKAHSLAQPFETKDVQGFESTIYHFGPLSKNDTPLSVIRHLKAHGQISIDAQGLLRDIINDQVIPCQWEQKEDGLPLIDIIKVNEEEAATLTGLKDLEKAAKQLAKYGIKEVVTTLGSKGSVILANDEFHSIPAYQPSKIVDATGCGDTYMAGYLFKRAIGKSIIESGTFGAAMATLKLENFGPFNGTEQDVMKVVKG